MRRSGRTFRAVLKALEMASSGDCVVYHHETIAAARHSFDIAVRVIAAALSHEAFKANRMHLNIEIKGAGVIYFKPRDIHNLKDRGLNAKFVEDFY